MADKKTPPRATDKVARAQIFIPAQAGQKVHFSSGKQGGVNTDAAGAPAKKPSTPSAPARVSMGKRPTPAGSVPQAGEKEDATPPPTPKAKPKAVVAPPKPASRKESEKPTESSRVEDAAAEAARSQSKVLVEAVTESFMGRLMAEAQRNGGSLSVQDLQTMGSEFGKKAGALENVFKNAFSDFGQVLERQQINKARSDHFDRLMVRQVSSLFPEDGTKNLPDDCLSRRIIPGFLRCMEQMVGLDASVGYQERARSIVERVQSTKGADFHWGDVYGDAETLAMVRDVLMHIIPFFAALQRRQEWFITIVNGNLRPFDAGRDLADEEEWKLTPVGFHQLAKALFSELQDAMSNPKSLAELRETFGEEALSQATKILGSIKD
ncbi:hypothetical protein [Magnetospira sp. QH-2]|uniref:hypothetical protein n=1 Tax=Magnetospira sp. (strain QH-2) TaxID=1288970 RepID=UPI0003E81288|nr:hypothetical protein [Magnetospira sp. QH-2]CCQ75248.1 protein of unknown function [Magnetospira sp. QH-2]